jgi:hypothetical protein
MVPAIAPVGPTFTRPELHVIPRLDWASRRDRFELYSADPDCQHYVTYGRGGGVLCIRCPGWFCA